MAPARLTSTLPRQLLPRAAANPTPVAPAFQHRLPPSPARILPPAPSQPSRAPHLGAKLPSRPASTVSVPVRPSVTLHPPPLPAPGTVQAARMPTGKEAAIGAAVGLGLAWASYQVYRYLKPLSPGYIVKIAFKPGVMGFSTQTIQEADATTDRSAEALARKVDNSGVTKSSHRMCGSWFKLTDLAPDGKLHIIGHGVPVQNNKGLVTHAESMSGYSMIEIANILINDLGLPADFNGQIVLHSCYSGLGSDNRRGLKPTAPSAPESPPADPPAPPPVRGAGTSRHRGSSPGRS